MGDRNLTAYPENKFPSATQPVRKRKYAPPTQKPINEVISSFSALDVASLAGEMYEDSGLLIRGDVLHELYDHSFVNPQSELVFEEKGKTDIGEFNYKSLSYEEKKMLLERLMEAEEKGFSPEKKSDSSSESQTEQPIPQTPPSKPKKKFYRKSPEQKRHRRRSTKSSSKSPHRSRKERSRSRDKRRSPQRKRYRSRSKSPRDRRRTPPSRYRRL